MFEKIKQTDNLSKTRCLICLIAGFFIIAILALNDYSEKRIGFNLSLSNLAENNMNEYTPHITLPKGEYDLSFSGYGGNSDIVIETGDGVTCFNSAKDGNTLTLAHDCSELIIKSASANLSNVTFTCSHSIFKDKLFLLLLFSAALVWLVYEKFIRKGCNNRTFLHIFLICMGLFTSYGFFSNYLINGHDLPFHLYRIDGIKDALLTGQFPVRLNPTAFSGYGYANPLYYPEIFLYFPAILRIWGVSQITAYKSMWVAANIATAFISYYSVKGISKSKYAALIASIIYTTCTWYILSITLRAAVGEGLAMVFMPLMIYGLYEILYEDGKKWWIFTAGCTGVFQSHIISTVISALLVIFVLIGSLKKLISEKRYIPLLKATVMIVLLNCWFIIPFISSYFGIELNDKFSLIQTAYIQRGSLFPAQIFNILNNKTGISQTLEEGMSQDMSFSLGIGVSIMFVVALGYIIYGKKEKLENNRFFALIFLFSAVSLLLTTSLFPWDYLREHVKFVNMFENMIQFPWRFLSISCPLIVITGTCIISNYIKIHPEGSKSFTLVIAVVCALSVVIAEASYIDSNIRISKGNVSLESANMGGSYSEYLPRDTNPESLKPNRYETSSPYMTVHDTEKNGLNLSFKIDNADDGGYVEVPLLYYPGYKADDGEKPLEIEAGNNGVIRVLLSGGTSEVNIKYRGLWIYKFGDIITLLTIMMIAAHLTLKRKYNMTLTALYVNIKRRFLFYE